jgi:hypothetical protein
MPQLPGRFSRAAGSSDCAADVAKTHAHSCHIRTEVVTAQRSLKAAVNVVYIAGASCGAAPLTVLVATAQQGKGK